MEELQDDREIRTIDLKKANMLGCFIYLPIFLIYWLPFYFLWQRGLDTNELFNSLKITMNPGLLIALLVVVLLVGILLHELIHGLCWAIFAKGGWRSIKFGVLWKYATPYCHCKVPLTIPQYTFGALMPFVVLGFLPAVVACCTGSVPVLLFAVFFTAAAIGDFMIVNMIRKEPRQALILDHPSEAGYYVYPGKEKERER